MKLYTLEQILSTAREKTKYYGELWRGRPSDTPLERLPLTDQTDYWRCMNECHGGLSGELRGGRIFRSGGTTGNPKMTCYTTEEWLSYCQLLADDIGVGILEPGDVGINIFYSGDLYASYDMMSTLHTLSHTPFVLLNVGGHLSVERMVQTLVEQQANIIFGVPSQIVGIAEYIQRNHIRGVRVNKIMIAGELMYPSQMKYINSVLGEVSYFTGGLAGNDYGIIAYCAADCAMDENRIDERACVFELIDRDSGQLITEAGRAGDIYITNLSRVLQPIVRYPTGDMAEYLEPPGTPARKFRLLGRGEMIARVGTVNFSYYDLAQIVERLGCPNRGFQMTITLENRLHTLSVRIAADPAIKRQLLAAMYEQCPLLLECEQEGSINKTQIICCGADELEHNPRTGKIVGIIDYRKRREIKG